ncbi:hypothetical protein [Phaeodactylibacter luteus]|uniref:LPP20 lipoprotein n=1 Tax=Phaeodactylibacter luteus TaxID=1564516 RepID=A0A5C6RN96_9BACT|nr:hypothetical protein [Phaeodactylibacter luteus]TXB63375.1 hypothetical protein FRY97_09390 [Phaeodactylibacter luteus]
MRTSLFWMLALLLAVLPACKSPQEALESGNYNLAFRKALDRLERGKGSRQDELTLGRALEKIEAQEGAQRQVLYQSRSPQDWERGVQMNEALQEKMIAGAAFLPSGTTARLGRLQREADQQKERLVRHHWAQGDRQMAAFQRDPQKAFAQKAAFHYEAALQYSNAEERINLEPLAIAARRAGTVWVRIDIDHPFGYRYEVNRALRGLEDLSRGFRVLSTNIPEAQADCLARIDFDNPDIDKNEQTERLEFEEEVIARYATVTNAAGRKEEKPVYETVKATVSKVITTWVYELEVEVDIRTRSRDCSLDECAFEASRTYEQVSYEITGDKRAVPEEIREYEADEDPDEEEWVEEMLKELADKILECLAG